MNRLLLSIAATIVALALGASEAVADCTPLEPKEWSGTLRAAFTGGWVTTTAFEKTTDPRAPDKCDWGGLEALNEFDAFVWEVKSHGGLPATIEASNPNPGAAAQAQGSFLTAEDCLRTGSYSAQFGTAETVVIPREAGWMVMYGYPYASGLTATVKAAGVTCEEKATVKKKKKKKKGRRQ